MKISFHGAAGTVTGSQHLIEVNGLKILLDCGLYQGRRKEARKRNREHPFEPSEIDVLVLSHAHIDHSGNIPHLVKHGFKGDIVCTFATRDLCTAMLRDSGHIQEKDASYLNRKRKKHGKDPIEPIYTEKDAVESLKYFLALSYDRPYRLASGITLTFHDAGHMLGSAIVALDIVDQEEKKDTRLIFSGDIGRIGTPILRDPTLIDEADILIMESTYGGRSHPAHQDIQQQLSDIVSETVNRGGKVIIPSFAVGRSQSIVYMLNKLYHSGDLPPVDVFVDSPLAVNATEIFRLHPEAYDTEAHHYMTEHDPDGDIFGFHRMNYIRHVEDSKALNTRKEPAIIISASGMVEAGRILHHVKNNIEDERTTILFVGWQAPHTLGRRLVEKVSPVRILGGEYELKAEVKSLQGFSGHADHDELIAWANAFKKKAKQVFLVHGEPDSASKLAIDLKGKAGYTKVTIPELHSSFEL